MSCVDDIKSSCKCVNPFMMTDISGHIDISPCCNRLINITFTRPRTDCYSVNILLQIAEYFHCIKGKCFLDFFTIICQ